MLFRLSCVVAVAVAGCASPPPMPPEYTPPQPGMVVTFADASDGKDGRTATVRHRIVENIDDRVVNVVTTLPNGPERENKTLRGIVTYQIWQGAENGVIVEDIRKNPPRDLWPLTPGNWSDTEGPIYIGQGRTEEAALKAVRRTGAISHRFEILRREEITVPAGKFVAYVVRRDSTVKKADGSIDHQSTKTYWYAPSIAWIVRLDTVTKRPGQPDRKARIVAVSVSRATAAK
jgi:hypothetical protein